MVYQSNSLIYCFIAIPAYVFSFFKKRRHPREQARLWHDRIEVDSTEHLGNDLADRARQRYLSIYEMTFELFGYVMLICPLFLLWTGLESQQAIPESIAFTVYVVLFFSLSYIMGLILIYSLKLHWANQEMRIFVTKMFADKSIPFFKDRVKPSNFDFLLALPVAFVIFWLMSLLIG